VNVQPTVSKPIPTAQSDVSRWFAEEVRPHESRLRTWLRRRFPSLIDLDDIIQESYLRLLRAKGAGKVRRAKPYLYSTARNAALDFFRHEQVIHVDRIAETNGLHVLDHKPDVLETVSGDEELALLSEAIAALPARCREVLVLRKLHGLSQKEIAQKLQISENTVAAQASTGMRRCIEYFRTRAVNRGRP